MDDWDGRISEREKLGCVHRYRYRSLQEPIAWPAVDRHAWIDALSTEGFHCRFDPEHPDQYAMEQGHGRPHAHQQRRGGMAWLTPMPRRPSIGHDAHLFLKIVQRGSLSIEQNGQNAPPGGGRNGSGRPVAPFQRVFPRADPAFDSAHSKRGAARARIRHSHYEACCPDRASPDVNAVRDFALSIATQMHQASDALMARLGGQCPRPDGRARRQPRRVDGWSRRSGDRVSRQADDRAAHRRPRP